jgi:hypothetical protein
MSAAAWTARAFGEADDARVQAGPGPGLDIVAYGALWGIAVWALDTLSFIAVLDDPHARAPVLLALALIWMTRGVILAVAAAWLAARVTPWQAWVAFPVVAAAVGLLGDGFPAATAWTRWLLGVDLPVAFLFTLWSMLVYGVPLFALCLAEVRSREVRSVLGQAEAARARSAAALDAARLEWHARRIDPRLLEQALQAIRRGVESADTRTAELVDALVEFLRSATAAMRRGRTSLAEEIEVLVRWARLRQLIDGRPRPRMVACNGVDPALRLAPMTLLSLVEAVDAACSLAEAPLRLTRRDDDLLLHVTLAPGDPARDAAAVRRLRARLGHGATACVHEQLQGDTLVLRLALPPSLAVEGEDHAR